MQYKDGKIIIIIEEFSVSGNTYNLNGIDLDHAVFFVREDRKKFRALLPAEYKINTTGANTDLVIEDGILNCCIAVQVGFDVSKISDEYNPTGNPDIVILKDQYNQLVKDFKNLWKYVEKQGLTSDALNKDIVIPVLKEGETIVMSKGDLVATPLVTAETELQKLLDELISKSHDILDDYVKLLTDNSKSDIQNYTEDKKTEIQDYIDENMEDFARKHDILGVLGVAYGGTFGTALTSIEKGKVYYYWDSVKKSYTPYQALHTTTKIGGFITPDAGLFTNISNTNLSYTIFDDTTNYKIYFDRQTKILKIIKKRTAKMTLESLVSQILNFIANSDYTILPGVIFSNFNTALVSSEAKVYTGYGIFQSTSTGIVFFYGENNTRIDNNSACYFHSGEISIQMEAK